MEKNKKNKRPTNREFTVQDMLRMSGFCFLHHNLAERLIVERAQKELEEQLPSMLEQMLTVRTNAELIRCCMERYIERIDELMEVIDEIKWSQPKYRRDDYGYDCDIDYDEEDDEC